MPLFIASYDLTKTNPPPHEKFIEEAAKKGWQRWVLSASNVWYRLPNTTLHGNFADREAAVQALKDTRAATQAAIGITVTMEKWIVTGPASSTFDGDVKQANKQ